MKITAALTWAVLVGNLASAQPASVSPGKPGTVDGSVTNSLNGDPLRKAAVTLQAPGSRRKPGGFTVQAMTDAAGHFHFDNVDPGTYTVNASRDGFTLPREQRGSVVTVAEEENVKDVTVKLMPMARVSGHVFDDDGDPIMLASVRAMRYGFNQGRRQLMPGGSANSNDLGEFQFSSLQPGRYIFVVNARPRTPDFPPRTRSSRPVMAYPTTYYPNGADPTQATVSELAPGASVANLDFRLRQVPAFHVRGRVVDAAGQPVAQVSVNVSDENEWLGNARGVATSADGAFDLPSLVPGAYSLTARHGQRPEGWDAEFVRQSVAISDQDVNGIALALSAGITIAGSFTVEGSARQVNGQVILRTASGIGQDFQGEIEADGAGFVFHNVWPGSYLLDVVTNASGLYVKSIRFGDTDVSNGAITVSQGAAGAFNVVLGTDGGQVQGTVQTSSGTAPAHAGVTLAPAGGMLGRRDLLKNVGADASGNFRIQDIAPGEYKVFAWEESPFDVIEVPEFRKALENRAASVTIAPGARESMQVQVISSQDVESERSKLQ